MSKEAKIKGVITEAFPHARVSVNDSTSATFEVLPDVVTFERLEQIATALNTKNINVERVNEGGGGCDTCGYGGSDTEVEIYVRDIKL
jgi:hypothetical protein